MSFPQLLFRGTLAFGCLALFAYGLLAAQLYLVGENPFDYHVDPTTVSSVDTDIAYLAAPAATTIAAPQRDVAVFGATPREAIEAFNSVALAQPGTSLAAGSPSELWVTYVQRSSFFGFPDYISVVAICRPNGGATLAVYSQSVYGLNDMGANKRRVDLWLSELGESLKRRQ